MAESLTFCTITNWLLDFGYTKNLRVKYMIKQKRMTSTRYLTTISILFFSFLTQVRTKRLDVRRLKSNGNDGAMHGT